MTETTKSLLGFAGTVAAMVAVLAAVVILIVRLARKRKAPINPVCGTVTSHFGRRNAPVAGASTNHNGVDISVKTGTNVRAPWGGTVTTAKNDTTYGGGLTVVVSHPNGYTTGYCHLSQFCVGVGDKVKAGSVIALSGNTGRTSGPHLHFTLTDTATNQKLDPETIFNFKA